MATSLSTVALLIAFGSLLTSVLLWRNAKRSLTIAGEIAVVDRSRWHEQQRPVFRADAKQRSDALDTADLHIVFMGPGALDSVMITILDDRGQDRWANGRPANVTERDANEFVWGGWQFSPQASDQVINRRRTRARAYSLDGGGDWDSLLLERTRPGHWMTEASGETWRRDHSGPVRLQFDCMRSGVDPWIVILEIDVVPVATIAVPSSTGRRIERR